MVKFSKNDKWKYSTIGLLAVLAVGFSFPQAFAHVTTSLTHNVGHILTAIAQVQDDIDDIKVKTDNLPSDPASQQSINQLHRMKTFDVVLDQNNPELIILPASLYETTAYGATVSFTASSVEENPVLLLCKIDEDTYRGEAFSNGDHEVDMGCLEIIIERNMDDVSTETVAVEGNVIYDVNFIPEAIL